MHIHICTHTYAYKHIHTHIYIYSCGQNYWHPWYIYDKKRLCKRICIVNTFDLYKKNKKKYQTFHWIIRILNGGGDIIMKLYVFLKYTLDTIIGTPRNS